MQDHSTVVALMFASILWEAWLHCNAAAKQGMLKAANVITALHFHHVHTQL